MSKITRRRFLEDSMFAAAAAGAATAGIHAMNEPRQAKAAVSANDKLGVCVVGIGGRGWGSHCKEWMNNPKTEILYICDPDSTRESKCDQIAEKQGGKKPKFVKDMREAFDDPAVDIVSNAASNHAHALCGVWAMQAGKDCYLEKPISHNVHEGKALVAAAKKYNRMCQVGTQCRSNPSNINANKFIMEGGLGEVKFARGLCYKRRKSIGPLGVYEVPETVDYDIWSGPATIKPLTRPRFHYDWHWQRLYGNGDMGNQGPHQTDIARWHLGIERFPNSVITYGGRLGYDVQTGDPDFVEAGNTANTEVSIFDYGDKCMVFETRGLETPALRGAHIGVIVYGSEGYLVQSSYSYSAAFDLDGNKFKEFKGGSNHFSNFLDAVEARDSSILNSDARCGHLSAGLAHIGNISYYLGEDNKVSPEEAKEVLKDVKSEDDNVETLERTVEHLRDNGVDLEKTPISLGPLLKFDPETETFIDHDEANAMLTRDYRAPYVVPKPDDV